MCGRYSLLERLMQLQGTYQAKLVEEMDWKPHYNIAPGTFNPIVVNEEEPQIVLAKWGLVPHWAKHQQTAYSMINARAETLTEKPAYKKAFEKRRCLIPFSNFYEWKKSSKAKIPYYIGLKQTNVASFAGIYEKWEHENQKLTSYAIITTNPNEIVKTIHDRMPVILPKENEKEWLNPDTEPNQAQELLKPYNPKKMNAYEISPAVNNPRNDSEKIIQPIPTTQKTLF